MLHCSRWNWNLFIYQKACLTLMLLWVNWSEAAAAKTKNNIHMRVLSWFLQSYNLAFLLCHFMHLVSSHIEWWTLKSLTSRCSSDLLSNCCKLYMKKSLLMFCRNSENDKYILWMCNIMFFSLRISNKKSDFECFII